MRGNWYISARAVRDYCEILGWNGDNDSDFARAEDALFAIAPTAHFVMRQTNGLLQYRTGRAHGRIRLLVSDKPRPEGPANQVVRVLPAYGG